ncbi:energy-coupled thiamine transporter ThiT [Companilactobacillus zhongbaensis]|uniref:energy-coupled thiamine transporter ThiT n=1 Tax=Companilactobacillus zhongbaensis TaxID=2486009 RepID=UPI000F772497|nr:energy-coupled thiamine transporter ThiT [Companilactobacillus zhongbaensis]
MVKNQKLIILTEGALVTAAAQVLSFIPHSFGVSSIELVYGLIPMAIFALRRGFKAGLLAGLVWGLLDLLLRGLSSGSVLNPLQGFLEYPVAFAAIGLIGIGSAKAKQVIRDGKNSVWWILLFSGFGIFVKYFFHFLAGGVFWAAFAPKGMNPWIYSGVINGGSFIANVFMVLILCFVLNSIFKKLIVV